MCLRLECTAHGPVQDGSAYFDSKTVSGSISSETGRLAEVTG